MASEKLNELLNSLLAFAKHNLQNNGEFYPFGAVVGLDGKIAIVSSYDGNEHPQAELVIGNLNLGFKTQIEKGEVTALGICIDVKITSPATHEKTDAIQVSMESKSGESITAFLPYEKSAVDGFKYKDMFAKAKQPEYFL